jgi:glycosyltransferase involved in cell wall biosynthesis
MGERPSEPKVAVLLEPDQAGHHLAYVRKTAERLLDCGWVVNLGLTGDRHGNEYSEYIAPLLERGCRVVPVSPGHLGILRATSASLRDARVGRVVVLDVDRWILGVLAAVFLSGRVGKLRLLITRPVQQEASVGARVRFLVKRLACSVVSALGPPGILGILNVAGSDWSRLWPRAVCLEDSNLVLPVPVDRTAAQTRFGISDPGALVLGILGVMSERKNPQLAMQAASLVAGEIDRQVILLCVGPLDSSVPTRPLVAASGVTLIEHQRFVSDEELSLALQACDLVLCLYSNEGSSGIVAAAVAHEVRVLAAGATGVRAMVDKLDAGTCCALTVEGVAGGIASELGKRTRQSKAPETNGQDIWEWATT